MVKEVVIFVPRKCSALTLFVCKVCFYFIVTLFTRSLVLVAALFVNFSLFANDYNSQTMTKGVCPSCVERTTDMNDRRAGPSGPMRAGFLPHVPPPASLLLGFLFCFVLFFQMSCPVDGAELSLCYLGVRDEVYEKTNEITVRKKTS